MQVDRQIRVLVVEDNDDLRKVIAVYLKSHGIDVLEAADGLAGLEQAAGKPDLILLDVLLPKIDGIEVLRRLRADLGSRDIPVLMMSAVLQIRDLRAETAHLDVAGIVQKPFQLRALLADIRSITGAPETEEPGVHPSRPLPRRTARRAAPAAPETARPALPEAADRTGSERNPADLRPREAIPLRGSIESLPLPFLMHAVFSEQRSCRLDLASDGRSRSIFFSGGVPVYAESSIPEETLGAHLVRRGIIDRAQSDRAVAEMMRSGRRFGEVLLKLGLIGPHDLYRELEEHLVEKVIGAFAWHHGAFEMTDGDAWKDGVIIARMPPGRIILSGCQRHWPAALVAQHVDLGSRQRCTVLEEPPYDDRQLALTTGEIRVLQLARKGLGPAEIAAAVPQPELVPPTLFALFVMKIVGFVWGRIAASAPVAPPADIAGLIASELTSEPPAPPRREGPARALLAEYLKLRTADYFTLLGVPREASRDEIEAAFQARQRRYHADTLVGIDAGLIHEKLEELYLKVQAAYRTLIDPDARRRYVAGLDGEVVAAIPSYAPPRREGDGAADWTVEQLFQEGQALLRKGEFRQAAERFDAAHAKQPDPRAFAYRAWASYLASPGAERVSFERALRELIKNDEREPLFPYLLANFFQRERNAKRAEALYEKVLEIDPRHIDAARQLRILRMRQRSDEPSGLFDIFRKG